MESVYNELISNIDLNQVYLNEPMSKHSSFKTGGPADILVKVKNLDELKHVLKTVQRFNVPLTVIGNGSNILVKDGGIKGIVLKLCFDEIIEIEEGIFSVGAGVLVPKLARVVASKGYTGLEFASGIPGTMGGAVKMNAGAYGGEIQDVIQDTTYIDKDLNIRTIINKEHEFGYRDSIFNKKDWIIISSKIKLEKGDIEKIEKKINENSNKRKSKQPIAIPSAGSTFKRGNDYIAAELIDKCGLKGYNIGDACVSKIHAGFIINKGNATSKDILDLIDYVKEKVYDKFNVNIELEIKILGED